MFTSAQALKSLPGGDSMDLLARVVQSLGCEDGNNSFIENHLWQQKYSGITISG